MKLLPHLIRTFVGIGYFLGGKTVRKVIEIWFKQLEWAGLISAVTIVALKIGNNNIQQIIFFYAGISITLLFIYLNYFIDDITSELVSDIDIVNRKNRLRHLKEYSYGNNLGLVAAIIVLIICISHLLILYYLFNYFI